MKTKKLIEKALDNYIDVILNEISNIKECGECKDTKLLIDDEIKENIESIDEIEDLDEGFLDSLVYTLSPSWRKVAKDAANKRIVKGASKVGNQIARMNRSVK